ncbi:MAG: UbiA family prenyltransferase [Candidatus Limnocylindrales bacterium]
MSRTSTSSSTSDGPAARLAALVRLVHPFPSVLDGLVVASVAILAGADGGPALSLGMSMTALQCSIGALNDVHDATADAGRMPPKPIPSGLVRPIAAWLVVVGTAFVGLGLAWVAFPTVVGLALIVLSIGYGYDLLAKGTPWSWLPFALGIPLLPVYGWVGAVGSVPSFFVALVPLAVLSGAALAVANGRADLEQDRRAGERSIVTSLGDRRAWAVHVGLWAVVVVGALGWLIGDDSPLAGIIAVVAVGGGLLGVALAGRTGTAHFLERVWEAEAVAAGLAAVTWLAAVMA